MVYDNVGHISADQAELPNTNPEHLPRMADYAKFAIASEKALGLKEGEFMATFNQSREQSRQIVVESSPVGEAIVSMMRDRLNWKGTATEFPLCSNHLNKQGLSPH